MRDTILALVLGTGQMGSGIARLGLCTKDLALVDAYARRAARSGLELGRAMGLGRDLDVCIVTDLNALLPGDARQWEGGSAWLN